ncbi:Erv1/Alr family protein [uncultured virus]|nr:Erv1/Alr family protein [uncultured virus]
MASCKEQSQADHIHNGLITKIWGEPGWTFGAAVTFGYPIKPTDQQREDYRIYFTYLGRVLPCRYCRESYDRFISDGPTKLTDEVLADRKSLTRWFYDVHNAVNNKLEIDYAVTYEDVCERNESFRAKCGKPSLTAKGCVAPLDYKAFSFKKLYYTEAPVVSLAKVRPLIKIAYKRGIDPRFFTFTELADALDGDFTLLKQQPAWETRNLYCKHQIRLMRENSVPSIETEGSWVGTPTIDELKLLLFLSSNLNRTEVGKALDAARLLLD